MPGPCNALNINQQGVVYFDGVNRFFGVDGSTAGFILTSNGPGVQPSFAATSSTMIAGTAGQIVVTPTLGVSVISIDPTYVGQASITTLGTITTGMWNATPIPLLYGGTNAALVASNGGIFYSDSSAGAILAGTATAHQLLLSGASSAPSWSTSTYPTTNAINTLLYASSANVMAALPTAIDGVLITSHTGVPSWLANSGTPGFVLTANSGAPASWQALSAIGAITTITGDSGGAQSPSAGNFNIVGSGSITVAGTANTETVQLTGLTNHAVLVGAGTTTITKVGPSATVGALFIGAGAAADPIYSTIASVTDGSGLMQVQKTYVANPVQIQCINLDTTSTSSNAEITARSAGVGGGDAYFSAIIGGVVDWNFGISHVDNSYKLVTGGPPSSPVLTAMVTDTAGRFTYPNQPGFLFALNSNTAANKTGDATAYIIGTDALTQVYQQGSDMATNGVFTASVAGLYFFQMAIYLYGLLVTHTQVQNVLLLSGGAYLLMQNENPFTIAVSGERGFQGSAIVSLTAGGTVSFRTTVSGGTKVVGFGGVSGAARTFISGYKLA